jgi:FkbM family methyltransferase
MLKLSWKLKWAIRRLASSRGIQIRKGLSLIDFLHTRSIDTVLDVGANTGQFALQLRALGYRGRIVSFEPVSEVYEQLGKNAARDNCWNVRRLALGEAAGQRVINISRDSQFSSLVPQQDVAVAYDANAAVIRTETIDVARLDDIYAEFAGQRVFLKIDTQGFERAVLAGSSDALKSILGIQLELPIEHLYADTWVFEDAIAFMRSAGFVLAQVEAVHALRDDPASAVEFDCVFRRAG